MTKLDFHHSTDNQNIPNQVNIFFRIPLKPGIYGPSLFSGSASLLAFCPFSFETENDATVAIMVLSILPKAFLFQL